MSLGARAGSGKSLSKYTASGAKEEENTEDSKPKTIFHCASVIN